MKIMDIKADGTVYWWHRGSDWGDDDRQGYDQRQSVRVDDKRYSSYGYSAIRTIREDPKGQLIAVQFPVGWAGYPGEKNIRYVPARQIRATYEEVQATAAKARAVREAAHTRRRTGYEQAVDKAAETRDRLTDLGLDELFGVRALEGYEGSKYTASSEPRVEIKFAGTADDLIALAKRLERAERLAKTL